MKSETSCGVLCQHPECWRANLRRVKEAVRARNGIKSTEDEEGKVSGSVIERRKDLEDGSLPTLKVIDLFEATNQKTGSAPHNGSLRPTLFHYQSSSPPSLSPDQSLPQSTSCTPTFHAPRPSPASPTLLTGYQKQMQWKNRVQAVQESDGKRCGSGQLSIVGVREMYDDEEWSQDWRDVYITSAYLIWCQTTKRKRRKAKSTGSVASRKDPRKVAFKDVTEEMIPAAMEKLKPKRPEPRRSPTVGQPFSPSRLSSHKKVHVQHLDLAVYGLDELKDFPSSVLAGIIQHLKPKNATVDQDLPLGLDLRLKQHSSVRSMVHGTDHRKGSYTADDVTGKKLEQALRDENSRVLLDIDINSHLNSPEDEEDIATERRGAEEIASERSGAEEIDDKSLAKREQSLGNAADQNLVTQQGRVPLPLGSVGVPTDHARKSRLHHCTNSIPRRQQLGIAMEPVDLVPAATATPTPTGTPAGEGEIAGFQLCTQPHSPVEVNLTSEHVSPTDGRFNRHWPVRGHITSALRHSPFPVRAPAPTPISPEKWGRYSRSAHTRERGKTSSGDLRRWETLSNVYDRQETGEEITCVPRASPEGEAEEFAVAVEPVFLTEGVLPRGRDLSPSSSRKAVGEWPQNRMIINVIENVDEDSQTIRSPSPGSKTCIPQDILAEFHGDPYGRKQIRVAGQKMSGKPSIVTQPQISTEYPGYIAAGWRPPRSRTPLQFLETPSRKAPKPLRQPPADSVPKSLTVQPLSTGVRRRPKSTPPRMTSPGEGAVQQVLSDSSLASGARDDLVALSMAAHAPSPSTDRGGSIPPPPSPEVPHSLQNGAVSSRLDPVSEAEESSAAAYKAEEASLSDVEEVNEEDESAVELQDGAEGAQTELSSEPKDVVAKNGRRFQATASERQSNLLRKQNQAPQSLISEQGVLSSTANERIVANDEELVLNENTASDRDSDAQAQVLGETTDTKEGFKEVGLEEGVTTAETNEVSEETADPPQPPGSPDLVITPDFTEGVDLSLDLEAELRAAMEGLDDMDDLGGTRERRPSSDLND